MEISPNASWNNPLKNELAPSLREFLCRQQYHSPPREKDVATVRAKLISVILLRAIFLILPFPAAPAIDEEEDESSDKTRTQSVGEVVTKDPNRSRRHNGQANNNPKGNG